MVFQPVRPINIPNTTVEKWSNTLLSEDSIWMRGSFLAASSAWNSLNILLQCRDTSDLSSRRSVAQAKQNFGTEKPWITQTVL